MSKKNKHNKNDAQEQRKPTFPQSSAGSGSESVSQVAGLRGTTCLTQN